MLLLEDTDSGKPSPHFSERSRDFQNYILQILRVSIQFFSLVH